VGVIVVVVVVVTVVMRGCVIVDPISAKTLKRKQRMHLPAGWWVHHHAGCSSHLNDDDNVIVVRHPSPSSIIVEVPQLSLRFQGRGNRSWSLNAAVVETAWPVGHCR
jgi:hypothetical protein